MVVAGAANKIGSRLQRRQMNTRVASLVRHTRLLASVMVAIGRCFRLHHLRYSVLVEKVGRLAVFDVGVLLADMEVGRVCAFVIAVVRVIPTIFRLVDSDKFLCSLPLLRSTLKV